MNYLITVLVDQNTTIVRLRGKNSALLLGEVMPNEKTIRIQYIFQHPAAKKSELLTVTYHLSQPFELLKMMRTLVSAIENKTHGSESPFVTVIQQILDQEYEQAASVAETIGLTVREGLP